MEIQKLKMKLLFPEPLFDTKQLSFSSFLYFQNEVIGFTLHPTVSIFMTGCDPFLFAELVEKENPSWKKDFNIAFSIWNNSNKMIHRASEFIKPLEKKYFKTIWLAYSRTEEALKENDDLIKSTNLSHEELLNIIDIPMASQELISHILFEKFLQIYQGLLPKGGVNLQDMQNKSYQETRAKNIDYKELIGYCNQLFQNNNVEDLFIKSYFYRIKALKDFPDILLSNERLIKFLNMLPVEHIPKDVGGSYYNKIDIIGWEIFRQLTSGYIDNISPEKQAEFIIKLRTENNDEVLNLKNKCLKLAEEYKGETNLELLSKNISNHVRINTEKEIKELLSLDSKQSEEILKEIFSDKKTWLALSAFFVSIATGGVLLTGGSALAALSIVAAKSFKVAAETKKKISSSDFSLIYRMHNREK